MPSLTIVLRDPPAWPDLAADYKAGRIMKPDPELPIEVAGIADGMRSADGGPNKPSLMFRVPLGAELRKKTGHTVLIFETSFRLFMMAAVAFQGKFGAADMRGTEIMAKGARCTLCGKSVMRDDGACAGCGGNAWEIGKEARS